jgi:phage tail sheath protein FI
MPFQLSPGVAVVEKDFSSIVPAVSSSVGAFAGSFAWGPVLQPITVSSENILVQRFGKPNDFNFNSFFSAANFLSYTNNLLTVRADGTNLKNAVHTKSGSLSTLAINNAGVGYVSTAAAPAVTISAPDITGGIQATATVTLSGGAITAIAVGNGGSGYSVAPTVVVAAPATGGTQATATATVSGGVITAFTITSGGTGYKTTPTVTITPVSGGTLGAAGAVTIGTSTITSITIGTAGSGYSSVPTVAIAAPPTGTTATVTVGTPTYSGVKIKNSEDYLANFASGQGLFGEFAAKYPGSLGNAVLVAYADSTTYSTWTYKSQFDAAPGTSTYAASVGSTLDEIHVIIIDATGVWTGTPGSVLEKFAFVSKASDAKKPDGTNNYYKDVINSNSSYVWWMDPPVGNTNWGQLAVNSIAYGAVPAGAAAGYQLSGGVDDYTFSDANQQEAYALFSNAELYDISLIIAGKTTSTNAAYIADLAKTRADAVAFVSPQSVVDASPIVGNTSTETDKIVAFRNAMNTIHSYAVMDSGVKYQYDRYNDKYRYVPLNADVAGLCARTDYSNDPWWSPGGYNRGQIKNVVRLGHNPDQTNRDTLYKAGINPVVSFPGQGIILYGDKTLQTKPSAFDRINVRRLFIVLEKAIATAAKFQLFEFNDSFTRAQFVNLVEPFLRDVQGRRGIVDFRVKCDDTNNTGQVIDSNQFVADIFIKPARSINFITLNFVAARSSANFTEIGG